MRRRWVRIANQRERNGGHPGLRIPKSCACGRRLAMLLSPFNRTLIRQRFARLFGIPSRSSRPVAIPAQWQIRDMQFLITDGETFFHEERRDLIHEFEYIDSDALAVRVHNRDREGRYCLIREMISDPHYPRAP